MGRKIMKEISCRSIPSYGHPIGNLFSLGLDGMTKRRNPIIQVPDQP